MQSIGRQKIGEQRCLYCEQNTSSVHGKNIELALETWVKMVKELGFKSRQASLLMRPNFVSKKGVETYLDALQARFGLKLNACALPFYLKTTRNKMTTINKPIDTKKVQSHKSIIEQHYYTKQTTVIEAMY